MKDALKLMLAFTPWLALWIIGWGHSLFRLQLPIGTAIVIVAAMAMARLHRGLCSSSPTKTHSSKITTGNH